jgi:ABC-type nitrate/sulfonate/bicarbonate transport system ATPase subunit
MTPPLLEITDLSATYIEDGRHLLALEHVSMRVEPGEFVCLIGPSGSGKSSLLDVVTGLFVESGGSITINGESLRPGQRPGATSYMRQRDLLMPWRTAVENAALAIEVHGKSRTGAMKLAAARFEEFGLAGFEDSYPAQLSGGMRQRVAFLRTVLADRDLMLLDEPFGALDALNRVTMQQWLVGMWERQKQGVVMVTHDVEEAVFLADRVIVLSARPGTVVHEEIISLTRPRTRTMVTDPVFLAHREALLRALGFLEGGGG